MRKGILDLFVTAVIGIVIVTLMLGTLRPKSRTYSSDTDSPFAIWVDDGVGTNVYYCQEVEVDGLFLTMRECEGYGDEQIELVGRQDWVEVGIEVVNQ